MTKRHTAVLLATCALLVAAPLFGYWYPFHHKIAKLKQQGTIQDVSATEMSKHFNDTVTGVSFLDSGGVKDESRPLVIRKELNLLPFKKSMYHVAVTAPLYSRHYQGVMDYTQLQNALTKLGEKGIVPAYGPGSAGAIMLASEGLYLQRLNLGLRIDFKSSDCFSYSLTSAGPDTSPTQGGANETVFTVVAQKYNCIQK